MRRVVIYDSNIENSMLLRYRKVVGHEESHDRPADEIIDEFRSCGYELRSLEFENFLALPISGGLQRPPIPIFSRFPSTIML